VTLTYLARAAASVLRPIGGKEIRTLRRLQRESVVKSLYVFVSERGAPLSVAGYQRMIARAGKAAKFPFLVHSHMLRHSTGYNSPTTARIRGRSKPTSATARSSRRSATRPSRRIALRSSGKGLTASCV
jgi:integrase